MAKSERAATWKQVPRGTWVGVTCSIEGCDAPAKCKGLCGSHYDKQRWADGVRYASQRGRPRRNVVMRARYGIDHDEYDRLLAEQGGRCAICRRTPSEVAQPKHWNGYLCVDHCHATQVVRGLLCNDCNLAVARLESSPDTARRAAEYLERHRGRGAGGNALRA